MANSYAKISVARQQDSELKVSEPKYSQIATGAENDEALAENVFHSMLSLELQRANRSRKPFVLMLLDANLENGPAEEILRKAVEVVLATKRETDLFGWYRQGAILGIIFTEVSVEEELPITATLRNKIETAFVKQLGRDRASKIAMSMHVFPESREDEDAIGVADSKSYSDLQRKRTRKRVAI